MTDQEYSDTQTLDPVAEVHDRQAIVDEAITVIDGALARMMQRDLVSTGEVADLLLDLRTLLTTN